MHQCRQWKKILNEIFFDKKNESIKFNKKKYNKGPIKAGIKKNRLYLLSKKVNISLTNK